MTVVIFIFASKVYMFAVIHGFLLPLIILMVILQLSSNYFYARYVNLHIFFTIFSVTCIDRNSGKEKYFSGSDLL